MPARTDAPAASALLAPGVAMALALLTAFGAACRREADSSPSQVTVPTVRARPLTDVVFARTPERLERGRYLADAAIGCNLCHSERDQSLPGAPPVPGREYGGAIFDEDESAGYRLIAPNLTPDVETGAGSWSDDMLARAIREGVGHDGRAIGGPMWWGSFRNLSDEDLASIIVYLRSLPPVHNPLPERLLSAELEAQRAASAQPLLEPVPARDLVDPIERGRYLIEIADCMGCHTAWMAPINPGGFAGGNPIERNGRVAWSINLTPDPSALGGWTEDIFIGAMRNGRGGTLDSWMPWAAYRKLTDEDLAALYRALQQVPPVRHWINSTSPPTKCAVCGQEHGLGEENVAPVYERAEVGLGPLDAYTGRYQLTGTEYRIVITASEHALFAAEEGGPAVELIPVEGGRFQGRGLISPIAFERDASGAVTTLLTFDLRTERWPRVG